jgi:hypothetical protein
MVSQSITYEGSSSSSNNKRKSGWDVLECIGMIRTRDSQGCLDDDAKTKLDKLDRGNDRPVKSSTI